MINHANLGPEKHTRKQKSRSVSIVLTDYCRLLTCRSIARSDLDTNTHCNLDDQYFFFRRRYEMGSIMDTTLKLKDSTFRDPTHYFDLFERDTIDLQHKLEITLTFAFLVFFFFFFQDYQNRIRPSIDCRRSS